MDAPAPPGPADPPGRGDGFGSGVDLAGMRRAYEDAGIDAATVAPDPFVQFSRWLADAVSAQVSEPNAMTLATVAPDGRPTARTVLLKAVEDGGFVFYTNYSSSKAGHLVHTADCALLFAWLPLARQVAVRGRAQRVPAADSDAYFATRPRGSQISAWASPQSAVIADRGVLDRAVREIAARYPGAVPRPQNWGGYRVQPDEFEFWQGRADRLHDRLRYRPAPADDRSGPAGGQQPAWRIERLAP